MRRSLVLSLASGMLLVAAATAPAVAQDTLKIGAPQPMTGPDAPFGDKFKKAYGMAVEEINAKGGVNGKKIEVIIDDHQAKNALAATVAEKLITQTKVLVLTGGRASGQAVEIASVAQRLKTPYVVDHPSADIITAKGFEWVFRNNPTGSIYPQAFNKFISEVPGAMPKSAAVVYDNSVFGKTISNSVMSFLKSKNVPIVNDEAYPVNSLDFKPVMTKVKSNNPDYLLLVAVATTDAILLTRPARRPVHEPEHLFSRPLRARAVAGRQAPERLAQVQRGDQLRLPGYHREAVTPALPLTLALSPSGGEGIETTPSPSQEGEGWGEGGGASARPTRLSGNLRPERRQRRPDGLALRHDRRGADRGLRRHAH